MGLNLSKEQRVARINLRKEMVSDLCGMVGLGNQIAKVFGVVDISGSTTNMFKSGMMQEIVERTIPIGLKFDDNGEIDMWDFSSGDWGKKAFHRLPTASLENFDGYVNREILPHHGGGTEYAPVLKDILEFYRKQKDRIPVFGMFYTDGDCSDGAATKRIIREISKHQIFIQFIGIGSASKDFLEALNDLDGTYLDNCGFCDLKDIENMDDKALYSAILNEFPEWLGKARKAGLIA